MLFRKTAFFLQPNAPASPAPDDPPVTETDAFALLREQYASFSCGPMSKQEAREQFYQLCAMPEVTNVGFEDDGKTLLVGTVCIDVFDHSTKTLREIGEFIISFSRVGKWYRFENITRRFEGRHHPHIHVDGRLCIQGGKLELETAFGHGDMPEAVAWCVAALRRVDRGGDLVNLNLYPRSKKELSS